MGVHRGKLRCCECKRRRQTTTTSKGPMCKPCRTVLDGSAAMSDKARIKIEREKLEAIERKDAENTARALDALTRNREEVCG